MRNNDYPPPPALVYAPGLHLVIITCSLHLKVIWQQLILPVAEGEGQKCQEEGVQDADNGENVGPAHCTVPKGVLICPLATHLLHLRRVPAVWVDQAAHHHQHGCRGRTRIMKTCNKYPIVRSYFVNNYHGHSSEPVSQRAQLQT